MSTVLLSIVGLLLVIFVWQTMVRPPAPVNLRSDVGVRRSLADCEGLLRLIHSLQQHRGMCAAWLAGGQQFEAPMRGKRRDVNHDIEALVAIAEAEAMCDSPCLSPYELDLLDTQWKELCAELDGIGVRPGVDDSITRHSLLVSHVLSWLKSLGERRVAPFAGPAHDKLLRTWLDTLPQLGEHLGQARAIGSSAAARGDCSPAERMRLMFLASRAESLMHQAIADAPRLPGALPATERVVGLIGILRSALPGSPHAPSAEVFFGDATAAVDAVYAWMNACEDALRNALAPAKPSAG